MAKKIKQYRLLSEDIKEGSDVAEQWQSGEFASTPIVQLGIQTLPGIEFQINNSLECVTIGQSGIYELELTDEVSINSIKFTAQSLKRLKDSPDGYLIVDTIYLAPDEMVVSE